MEVVVFLAGIGYFQTTKQPLTKFEPGKKLKI